MRKGSDPALPSAFFEATVVVCREGGLLAGVQLVVKGFFCYGGRKFVYLEMFMIVSKDLMWAQFYGLFTLVKLEELILKVLKDRGRTLC